MSREMKRVRSIGPTSVGQSGRLIVEGQRSSNETADDGLDLRSAYVGRGGEFGTRRQTRCLSHTLQLQGQVAGWDKRLDTQEISIRRREPGTSRLSRWDKTAEKR